MSDEPDDYFDWWSFARLAQEEKIAKLFKAFLVYPSVINYLRSVVTDKGASDTKYIVAFGRYETILKYLSRASRDEDPFIRHFAKTTYRGVLDAGNAVLH
jgi:hypothetical protein